MTYFNLPKNEMVGYSPSAFMNEIFNMAVSKEIGCENERIFAVTNSKNKNKLLEISEKGQPITYTYKQISEMYYSSMYALAINKTWNIKHDIISSDSPDIIFINQEARNDRVGIEIYEGFNYEQKNIRGVVDVAEEVKKLHKKKGEKKYDIDSRLLVINRVKSTKDGYNVSEYARCLEKFKWTFLSIVLCLYREGHGDFTFFYVYPKEMRCKQINYNLKNDTSYLY
jgi:hypothetical protein